MLNKLIAFSLKHRLLIVVASLLILLTGAVISRNMHIDVLPDLNRPTVTIITEAHAMVPEDVERLVTRPIEQGLNGATGVSRIRSTSGLGLSVVLVGMLLAASTGIVGATVVTMGLLSLPSMLQRGYHPSLATGTICATGTLGQIIPPSIALVLL